MYIPPSPQVLVDADLELPETLAPAEDSAPLAPEADLGDVVEHTTTEETPSLALAAMTLLAADQESHVAEALLTTNILTPQAAPLPLDETAAFQATITGLVDFFVHETGARLTPTIARPGDQPPAATRLGPAPVAESAPVDDADAEAEAHPEQNPALFQQALNANRPKLDPSTFDADADRIRLSLDRVRRRPDQEDAERERRQDEQRQQRRKRTPKEMLAAQNERALSDDTLSLTRSAVLTNIVLPTQFTQR